jgi:hypothetical protein
MEQLYLPVKNIHNIIRWLFLVIAVITIVKYFLGWKNKSQFKLPDNRLSLIYVSILDLQFLIGVFIYFFLSHITQSVIQLGDAPLQDANTRFFAIEHPAIMVLGIIFAHVGRVVMKKATTDQAKFGRGAIWFTLSLILILAGMPW